MIIMYDDTASARMREQTIWVNNKCSTCGKGIENLIDSKEWYENEKPNYCPFCGRWINFYSDKRGVKQC